MFVFRSDVCTEREVRLRAARVTRISTKNVDSDLFVPLDGRPGAFLANFSAKLGTESRNSLAKKGIEAAAAASENGPKQNDERGHRAPFPTVTFVGPTPGRIYCLRYLSRFGGYSPSALDDFPQISQRRRPGFSPFFDRFLPIGGQIKTVVGTG